MDSLRSVTEGVDLCLIVCHTNSIDQTTMHNRYDMLTAFTREEMDVLFDLVMFHDECPDHIDQAVFDMVQDKVHDAYQECN